MNTCAHLWAVGFAEPERADQVRSEVARLASEKQVLDLLDSAVAVRFPDGSFTLDGEPFTVMKKPQRGLMARLLASLALGAPPLTGPAVGTLLARIGATADTAGISEDFVREVEDLVKPGTSALFVLDHAGNMDAILRGIRGLGGTVLKTNVDLERAELIQSTLSAREDTIQPS
jgi:uncharacterized membrane protein